MCADPPVVEPHAGADSAAPERGPACVEYRAFGGAGPEQNLLDSAAGGTFMEITLGEATKLLEIRLLLPPLVRSLVILMPLC
jgi:hypothetical protein